MGGSESTRRRSCGWPMRAGPATDAYSDGSLPFSQMVLLRIGGFSWARVAPKAYLAFNSRTPGRVLCKELTERSSSLLKRLARNSNPRLEDFEDTLALRLILHALRDRQGISPATFRRHTEVVRRAENWLKLPGTPAPKQKASKKLDHPHATAEVAPSVLPLSTSTPLELPSLAEDLPIDPATEGQQGALPEIPQEDSSGCCGEPRAPYGPAERLDVPADVGDSPPPQEVDNAIQDAEAFPDTEPSHTQSNDVYFISDDPSPLDPPLLDISIEFDFPWPIQPFLSVQVNRFATTPNSLIRSISPIFTDLRAMIPSGLTLTLPGSSLPADDYYTHSLHAHLEAGWNGHTVWAYSIIDAAAHEGDLLYISASARNN